MQFFLSLFSVFNFSQHLFTFFTFNFILLYWACAQYPQGGAGVTCHPLFDLVAPYYALSLFMSDCTNTFYCSLVNTCGGLGRLNSYGLGLCRGEGFARP